MGGEGRLFCGDETDIEEKGSRCTGNESVSVSITQQMDFAGLGFLLPRISGRF